MTSKRPDRRSRAKAAAALVVGSLFVHGFLESCDDRFIGFTRFVDPCGTFLANCQPGDFETNRADIGDFCVDPTCSVPGGCGNAGPALGTQRDICP